MTELDYTYYLKESGLYIDEDGFLRLKSKAESILQNAVCGAQLADLDGETVAKALCEICVYLQENRACQGFLSETLDGYHVTYDKSRTERELRQIIRRHFGNTGVLYRGRC